MDDGIKEDSNINPPPISNSDSAIGHFRNEMASGKHWYLALLESIGLWTDDSEEVKGKSYRYLIDGEAFDWLLLARRLCEAVGGDIPPKEKSDLLLKSKPPLDLTSDQFKTLIGGRKYHQYLNYFYGVTVEEALLQAVREEVRKERHSGGAGYRARAEEDESFRRIYGDNELDLMTLFRAEKAYSKVMRFNLSQKKEFIYWLFKYRIRKVEKAKVASDTQKGLNWLKKGGFQSQN